MADPAYLAEERGRRTTANWLLDLVARRRPSGRLLEIGCGHGLLLDEARRRGYETTGLELSASSAAHARDRLGLDVREQTLERLAESEHGGYDAVLLVDVIEHLDDPCDALRRCQSLLAPGGVLCVVTPDPSSATARAAGARWWGYLPAHTYLLPRRTLRELITAGGLVLTDDVAPGADLLRQILAGGVRRARRADRGGGPCGCAGDPRAPVALDVAPRRAGGDGHADRGASRRSAR